MATFSIITDSACDLSKAQRERFGIDAWIGSEVIFPDGHSEKVDSDWNNITPDAYFGSMVDKKLTYKSSAPGPEPIKNLIREELLRGRDALCITLSYGMSSMYNNTCLAAKELSSEFPERTIRVIDSKRYSTAMALLCIYAAQQRAQGKSCAETAKWIVANLNRVHQAGWMDDLFFLARAGRLSKGTAIMGAMVGVKPMADFNMETGMFQVIGKARGVSKAFRAVSEYVRATIESPSEQILFVAHSLRAEYAERLKLLLMEEVHPREIIINSVGQACGANIGPGLIATYYFGKPLSDGLVEEAAILQRILK